MRSIVGGNRPYHSLLANLEYVYGDGYLAAE